MLVKYLTQINCDKYDDTQGALSTFLYRSFGEQLLLVALDASDNINADDDGDSDSSGFDSVFNRGVGSLVHFADCQLSHLACRWRVNEWNVGFKSLLSPTHEPRLSVLYLELF